MPPVPKVVGSIVSWPGGIGYVVRIEDGRLRVCRKPGDYAWVDPKEVLK